MSLRAINIRLQHPPLRLIQAINQITPLVPKRHSHIGKAPIKFPDDVTITTKQLDPQQIHELAKTSKRPVMLRGPSTKRTQTLIVKGPKGSLELPVHSFVSVNVSRPEGAPKSVVTVQVEDPKLKFQKAMWGTTRALLNNMITGVTEGFMVPLRINGVGYRALMEDGKLSLKLGYSHPILLDIPEGVSIDIPTPQRIILQGIDLQKVKQFAFDIRKWRKPEPYNQKGIFVGDETIKKKEGKKR